MKNINSFSNFLNEAVQAQLLKDLIKDKDRIALDALRGLHVDLSRLTDADITLLNDPKVITKKPYTSLAYIILVFGDTSVWIPGKDDEKGKYVDFYKLLYIISGSNIHTVHARHNRRRGNDIPNRRNLIEDAEHYKFYAVRLSKDAKEWSELDQVKLRNERNIRKANVAFPNDLEEHNRRQAQYNQNRYSEKLKKIISFEYLYQQIDELMDKVTLEYKTVVTFLKYLSKDDNLDKTKWKDLKNLASKSMLVSKEYVTKLGEEFDSAFSFSSEYSKNDGTAKKMDLLKHIAVELTEKLDPHNSLNKDELLKIKKLSELLKSFPLNDTSDMNKYINSNKWRDSEKLKDVNKTVGVFEKDETFKNI